MVKILSRGKEKKKSKTEQLFLTNAKTAQNRNKHKSLWRVGAVVGALLVSVPVVFQSLIRWLRWNAAGALCLEDLETKNKMKNIPTQSQFISIHVPWLCPHWFHFCLVCRNIRSWTQLIYLKHQQVFLFCECFSIYPQVTESVQINTGIVTCDKLHYSNVFLFVCNKWLSSSGSRVCWSLTKLTGRLQLEQVASLLQG